MGATLRSARVSPTARTTFLTAALLCGAVALNAALLNSSPEQARLVDGAAGLALLAALFAASEKLVIHVRFGTSAHSFSVIECVLVLGLLHASPTVVMASIAAGTSVSLVAFRRQSIRKVAFNTASYAFASQVGCVAFRAGGSAYIEAPRTWLSALGGAASFAATAAVMVWVVISVQSGSFRVSQLIDGLKLGLGAATLTASSGIVAAILLSTAPLAAPLMLVPIGGAFLSNVMYARERRRAEELNFLRRSSESVLTEQVQSTAIQALIDQAVQQLKVHHVEVQFEDDGNLRVFRASAQPGRASAAGAGVPLPLADSESSPGPAVLRRRRNDSADGVDSVLASRGLSAAVLAPIHIGHEVVGTLLLGECADSVFVLGAEDRRVAETIAGHIAVVLENSKLKRSVGDLQELKHRLMSELQHDSLTGLANRSAFMRAVRELLPDATSDNGATAVSRAAVMFIDLDDFKQLNDAAGHAAGDALLREVANRLRMAIRPNDLAARLGGDEFAVLVTDVSSRDEVHRIASGISSMLAHPFTYDSITYATGASIGVSMPRCGDDYRSLADRADMAMYRAKAAGKGNVETIDPDTDEADQRAKQLVADLKRGMRRNELFIELQPVVSFTTDLVESFEALVRWDHETLGRLGPDAFLPLSHDQEMLRALDDFVLEEAIAALHRLDDQAQRIALNVRSGQLGDGRLLHRLGGIDHRHRLILEVSVRELRRSGDANIRALVKLRDAGLGITIDDMTTDTVPFTALDEIRPTHVKLARNVISELHRPMTRSVIRSLAAVGGDIGFTVVAKGVESQEQCDAARDAGCGAAQGFLFSERRTVGV